MDSSSSVTKNSETNCEGQTFIAVNLRAPPFRSDTAWEYGNKKQSKQT
jgi:hypothetical protein